MISSTSPFTSRAGRRFTATFIIALLTQLPGMTPTRAEQVLENDRYRLQLEQDGSVQVTVAGISQRFDPHFTVLVSAVDPKMSLRWGNFSKVRK